MDISWLLFLTASVALIATPGQDLMLVMSRSVTQGQAAGVVTALGISTGLLVHTVFASLGLGLVLQTSEWLYLAIKTVGAGYLVYLGIRAILSASNAFALAGEETRSLGRLFFDGAFSNVANPKVAVFFLAFLPQFVSPDSANPTAALFVLGLALAALTFLIKGPLAVFAGRLSRWFRQRPAVLSWLHRTSGVVLIGLGLKLALERRA